MTTPTDDDRARLRAHLDRRPPQRFDAVGLVGAALLEHRAWRAWFDGDAYLGEVSGRVGPDACGEHRCDCAQCSQQPKEQP